MTADQHGHPPPVAGISGELITARDKLNPDATLYDSPAMAREVQGVISRALDSLDHHFGSRYPVTTPPADEPHRDYQDLVDQLHQAEGWAQALQNRSSVSRGHILSLRRHLSSALHLLERLPPNTSPLPTLPLADSNLSYRPEDQAWYRSQLPLFTRLGNQQAARRLAPLVDIVVLTVNEREYRAVFALLDPWPERGSILAAHVDEETYYFGQLGSALVALSRCEMGSLQPGSAGIATLNALRRWRPRAIIMAGVAFGCAAHKQRIGDILVATDILPYNPLRSGEHKIFRGRHMPADPSLINRFRNAIDWVFMRPDNYQCRLHFGALLSGEELIDNYERRQELLNEFPEAIGGEMEGTGLSAAAVTDRTPWILVKGICDWADGKKGDEHQALAAAAAASVVKHVLADRSAFEQLHKPSGRIINPRQKTRFRKEPRKGLEG